MTVLHNPNWHQVKLWWLEHHPILTNEDFLETKSIIEAKEATGASLTRFENICSKYHQKTIKRPQWASKCHIEASAQIAAHKVPELKDENITILVSKEDELIADLKKQIKQLKAENKELRTDNRILRTQVSATEQRADQFKRMIKRG
jgi:hypothetical protein